MAFNRSNDKEKQVKQMAIIKKYYEDRKLNNNFTGQVGKCLNRDLGIKGGKDHFVYVRTDNGKTCEVSTITSLEEKGKGYKMERIADIKNGFTYPLTKHDGFNVWSGVTNTVFKVDKSKINLTNNQIDSCHHLVLEEKYKRKQKK